MTRGMSNQSNVSDPTDSRRRPSLLSFILYGWSNSVWFGIFLLSLIFIYSSAGSAYPPIRQHPSLDMTEMEWFHWWPFLLMIAMMCINITVVTFKQIPFRKVNLGVWTIHTGILMLSLGSVYYFGTKLEGDAPVFRRRAVIELPGHEPVSMLIRLNNHVSVGTGSDAYHFSVSQIFPNWNIASGDDKGKTAYMAWIDVVTPTQKYTRQLLAGFPQYTEDILPDRTRAKKTLGNPLVDDTLSLTLDYEPQDKFFLMDTSALHVRVAGADEWVERPMDDLPRYHDHIAARTDAILSPLDRDMPLRPLDMPVPALEKGKPGAADDPLTEYDVRVNAYLRYAIPAAQWATDGDRLNPVAKLTLKAGPSARLDYDLVAFDARRSTAEQGQIAFRWVASQEALDQLSNPSDGKLVFHIPETGQSFTVPIDDVWPPKNETPGVEPEFRPLEGSRYAYRVKSVIHDLVIQSGERSGATMSVATVELKTPDRIITRFVANLPDASRDIGDDQRMVQPDPIVNIEFNTGGGGGLTARVTLVAGPDDIGAYILFHGPDGSLQKLPIVPGGSVSLSPGVEAHLIYLITHAEEVIKPKRVPESERQRGTRRHYAMIRATISKGDWEKTLWLQFNDYALPNEQYRISRRINYSPVSLRLPDGKMVEMMFSRKSHPLPTPIALESFDIDTHLGGYTGDTNTIRDFVSKLRFKTDTGWSDTMQMSSNRPATEGGFWYFQSTWDPPSPAAGYGGMNYTGIGVGNRNGVYIQLTGTCIAVAGMLYAFYYKPVLRRRMQDQLRAKLDKNKADKESSEEHADAEMTEQMASI